MAKECILLIPSYVIQMTYGPCDKKGMIKTEAFHEYPLEEGTIIDGVIIDDSSTPDILKELQENDSKEARFVIDNKQALVENIRAPQLPRKELLKATKGELTDTDGDYKDLICDYNVLQSSFGEEEKRGEEILCCAVERRLFTSYTELFDAIGIRLRSVSISINALHKLTQELADLNGRTYIISILDGNNASSYLFEKNYYTSSNRTRLFSERGTQAFASEMNNNISQLIQSSKPKQSPYPIERAHFCGLDDAEGLTVFESMHSNLNLQAERFLDFKIVYVIGGHYKDLHSHGYVFPMGCLTRKWCAGDASKWIEK